MVWKHPAQMAGAIGGQVGSAKWWDKGASRLGEVSKVAVEGCQMIWKEVMKLWKEKQQQQRKKRWTGGEDQRGRQRSLHVHVYK
jgi:hypothetical protein